MSKRSSHMKKWSVVCLLLAGAHGVDAADSPDFLREVRPILASHCFKCHGPDEVARKGRLRLDTLDGALAGGKSGKPAIVPGKPGASPLLTRTETTDPDEVMPPPSVKHPITSSETSILRRWIEAGAEFRPHWAFLAPRQVPVPRLADGRTSSANPIDAFVRARLSRERLQPSDEADAYSLCRRLYLDLIGLPPEPAVVDDFVARHAASPREAYEQLVDRLLASPQYGERWARKWLDLARYADTNGYEKDRDRNIWPYRDWVIRAINGDMPFDRFTTEQIAGDMLPAPTTDQRIATGFHRNTMLNEEGGIDPLEFRFHAMTDRVNTTGTTWLGLTIGCAQCHTHKYDPILQREYYQVMAFLNNADEPDLDLPAANYNANERDRLAEAETLLGQLPTHWPLPGDPPKASASSKTGSKPDGRNLKDQAARKAAAEAAFAAWVQKEQDRAVVWKPLKPVEAKSNLPLLSILADGSVLASGDISKSDLYQLKFEATGLRITALRLEALPDESLPAHGPGLAYYEGPKGDFFLGEFQISAGGKGIRLTDGRESYAKNHFGSSASAKAAIDGDPQTGWSCAGREGEAHVAVFIPDQPFSAAELGITMMFGRHYACSLGRFRISATTDARGSAAPPLPAEIAGILAMDRKDISSGQLAVLREYFLLDAPELADRAREIKALRRPAGSLTTLVMRERPQSNPRPTFVHNRGEFLQPKEPVEPAVPAFLPPLPSGSAKDRLNFARWLVSRNNPLTARVVVNRQWSAFFGQGLVRTVNDFGFQGELPSHPELLDWLAVEFMNQGWSMKKLHRMIVMSETYRQDSRVTSEHLAKDPQNRLLARAPRVRLDAEVVRDSVLSAGGLLTGRMHGPPVRPPQPSGVTEVAYGGAQWNASTGEDRWRRSIYTYQKRSAPFAWFNTFDAPSGETCVARRELSNTPLQSLTLLNDVALAEAAQHLGTTASALNLPPDETARQIFRRMLVREPRADELVRLVAFAGAQRRRFENGELKAAEVAGPGTGAEVERAVWTTLARAVFNLDESVMKP